MRCVEFELYAVHTGFFSLSYKQIYVRLHTYLCTRETQKTTVVNREFPFLHGGSIAITLTIPLSLEIYRFFPSVSDELFEQDAERWMIRV